MTTADYLTQLQQDREDLVDNLEAKGITGLSGDETFTELVPEVLNIPSGADLSEYFKLDFSEYDELTYGNITSTLIKKIPNISLGNGASMNNFFYGWRGSNLIVPTITSNNSIIRMQHTFENIKYGSYGNERAVLLDLTNLIDTSNVEDYNGCFASSKISEIIGFDKIKVTNKTKILNAMFTAADLSSMQNNLDFSNWNTSNVTNMSTMFQSFKASQMDIDLSSFNTSKVTNMGNMFYSVQVKSIDVSSFDTSNVTNMANMFMSCGTITNLDLSSFVLKDEVDIGNMFRDTKKLAVLDISKMDFSNVSTNTNMFLNCGQNCLQTDGAYADGIPYVYVKDATAQTWVLNHASKPASWTTNNVVIKQN